MVNKSPRSHYLDMGKIKPIFCHCQNIGRGMKIGWKNKYKECEMNMEERRNGDKEWRN
jgi:hypothetical protein